MYLKAAWEQETLPHSFERAKRGSRMSLDGTMPIGIELPPGFESLFRSWCTSVYATLHLRKEILGMYNSIIAVEKTVGADRRRTELCVLQHDSECIHVTLAAMLKAFFPTDELPKS